MFIILSCSDRFFGNMFSEKLSLLLLRDARGGGGISAFSKDFGFQPAGGQLKRFFGKILGADFRVILGTGINSEHFWGRFAIEKFDSEGCIR